MKRTSIILLGLSLAMSSSAMAYQQHGDDTDPRPDDRGQPHNRQADDKRDPPRDAHADDRPAPPRDLHADDRGPGRDHRPDDRGPPPPPRAHRHARGERLGDHRGVYVKNYRSHHLAPPPRGHQWRKVDNDYVLISVATGIITSVIAAGR